MKKINDDYKYIYVDSIYSINFLKEKIHLDNFNIISFNPSLILNSKLNVSGIENNSSPNDFTELGKKTYKYSGKIYKKIIEFNNDKILGIWLARYLVSIQNTLYRAKKTKEYIKNQKCLFIKLNLNEPSKNKAINGYFFSFMAQYKNCDILEIDCPKVFLKDIGRDPHTKFLIRFHYESNISILFRFVCIFCKCFNRLWPFKIIFYSHENTLLKRAAFNCFLRGYFILPFPKKLIFDKCIKIYQTKTLEIFKIIKSTFINYQREILGLRASEETNLFFDSDIKNYINEYITSYEVWNNKITKGSLKRLKAVLFGYPNTAMELAFASIAESTNIKTVSFQHAISKEISKEIISIDSIYESNIVDYYFVYNENTAIRSKDSRFHKAEDITIGLPEDLKKGIEYKNKHYSRSIPILYACTTLYCGNRGITNRSGASDKQKAEFEIDLIENVLSKIPHKVQYKPYFSKRYLGDSIELSRASSKKNIIVNRDEIDLRYIIQKSQIVLTSRATSTVGWCIFSSRPVIYIENTENRLNKEATNIFKKSLFFFDVLDAGWKERLFRLLSRDISSIESEWVDKQESTNNLIFKFLGYNKNYKDTVVLDKILKK